MKPKKDPYTGEEFTPRRRNQKFKTLKNKQDYHNQREAVLREAMAEETRALRKNFRILTEEVGLKKEVSLHKQYLKGKGFCFTVFNRVVDFNAKAHLAVSKYAFVDEGEYIKIVQS